jgi:hypothetical protein
LDFALGAGIVGVALIFLTMFLILRRSTQTVANFARVGFIHHYILWAILIMMPLWTIAELSDREFIEHFFFMLTFFSILSIPNNVIVSAKKNY